MSGEIIDITSALEERHFKTKEDRVKRMREAFRVARLGAKSEAKSPTLKSVKTKNKGRKTKR